LGLETKRAQLALIQSAQEVVEAILKATEKRKTLMIIALWFTWSKRNAIREEGRRRSSQLLARCVEQYAKENEFSTTTGTHLNQIQQQRRWVRPPMDTLKLNCDPAFFAETHIGSWGVIIRDVDGDVVSHSGF